MTDLVERLRQYGPHDERSAFRICDEAADEIERLRVERNAQYDENVNRIAAEGAAILRAETAEAEIERLRETFEAIQAECLLPPQLQDLVDAALKAPSSK
jgi:hypothetical protein